MGNERFGRWIVPDEKRKGVVVVGGGLKLKNPVKEVRISPEHLNNLESLMLTAFGKELDSSVGQAFLAESNAKITRAYPSEQPEEAWRRTLATIMGEGADIESVAGSLLAGSERFKKALNFANLSKNEQDKILEKVEKRISKYWPSSS